MATFVGNSLLVRDIGYVAGVDDGEGWMLTSKANQPVLGVKMTDLDVLERLQRTTGVGNITGPLKLPGRKPAWTWSVTRSTDVAALIFTLYPLLCARRQRKAREVLAAWQAMPYGTRPPAACGTASGYQ